MKEIYEVTGTCTITVKKRVLANSPEEALEKAEETFGGIRECLGNGGDDKLIGVDNNSESIFANDYIEWDENDIVITDDDRIDEDEEDEDDDYYDDDEWDDEDDEWED